jgi:hypothetical protein
MDKVSNIILWMLACVGVQCIVIVAFIGIFKPKEVTIQYIKYKKAE